MGPSESIQFFTATDVGRVRDHNEDSYLVDKKLSFFVVADGMGGHAAGEVASALAVRLVHQELREHHERIASGACTGKDLLVLLEGAVQRACARIHEEATLDPAKRGMGTTLSALLVVGAYGYIAHVGDSRIYLCRQGRVEQITEDHTVSNELLRRGQLTREQIDKIAQKNAITRAVGVYAQVDVDTLTIEVLPGDQFLLVSDGLHGYVAHHTELEGPLAEESGELATRELIDLANTKGGKDNITVVLVRLDEGDGRDNVRAKRLALKRDVLMGVPLFSRLHERELLRIMQVAEVIAFEPLATIFTEGQRGDELFIVLSGHVRIARRAQRARPGGTLRRDGPHPQHAALGDGHGARRLRAHRPAAHRLLRGHPQRAGARREAALAVSRGLGGSPRADLDRPVQRARGARRRGHLRRDRRDRRRRHRGAVMTPRVWSVGRSGALGAGVARG
jgi:serine/threonine protein phosphatase PrpC